MQGNRWRRCLNSIEKVCTSFPSVCLQGPEGFPHSSQRSSISPTSPRHSQTTFPALHGLLNAEEDRIKKIVSFSLGWMAREIGHLQLPNMLLFDINALLSRQGEVCSRHMIG